MHWCFLLAQSGLLDGRQTTTHWKYQALLKKEYLKVEVLTNRLFVQNEQIYSSAGVASGIDLGLYLLEEFMVFVSLPPLQDGIEVLDFAGPMEVFAYAGFNVFTVSKTKNPIISQGILKIIPDYSIDNAPAADMIAFFGGNTGSGFDEKVITWLKLREKNTEYFFSVCTGAFALGKAGILDNKTATTFHLSIDTLRKSFPKTKVVADTRFVDNGNVITTAGISAGIDGALHLVAKLRGEKPAKETALYMEYDKWIPKEGLIIAQKP